MAHTGSSVIINRAFKASNLEKNNGNSARDVGL